MTCPNCLGLLVNWSEPNINQFGNACLECNLFVWQASEEIGTTALDEVHFPQRYRGIPKYRNAVGWRGPVT